MIGKSSLILATCCIILAIVSIVIFVSYSALLNEKETAIFNIKIEKDFKINSLENQISNFNDEITSLSSEISSIRTEKDVLENQVNTLSSETISLQNEVNSLEIENNDLDFQVITLNSEKIELEIKINNLESEKKLLQSEFNSLELDYQQFQSTHSITEADYWDYVVNHLYTNEEYDLASFDFYYIIPEQQYGVYNLEDEISDLYWLHEYEENVFDCSEMSAYLEWYLENHGWNTVIVVGDSPFSDGRHAWLLVEAAEGAYMPVESTNIQIVWWSDPNFDNYFVYDYEFENILEALNYLETDYDWWT